MLITAAVGIVGLVLTIASIAELEVHNERDELDRSFTSSTRQFRRPPPTIFIAGAAGAGLAVWGLNLSPDWLGLAAESLLGLGAGSLLARQAFKLRLESERRQALQRAAVQQEKAAQRLNLAYERNSLLRWLGQQQAMSREREKLFTRLGQMATPLAKLEELLTQPLPEKLCRNTRQKVAAARKELAQIAEALQSFELLMMEQILQGIYVSLEVEIRSHAEGRRTLTETGLRGLVGRWANVISNLRERSGPKLEPDTAEPDIGPPSVVWSDVTSLVTAISPDEATRWLEGQLGWAWARNGELQKAVNACLAQQHLEALDRASEGKALMLEELEDLRVDTAGSGPDLQHELAQLELGKDHKVPALAVLRAVQQFRVNHGTSKAWISNSREPAEAATATAYPLGPPPQPNPPASEMPEKKNVEDVALVPSLDGVKVENVEGEDLAKLHSRVAEAEEVRRARVEAAERL